MGTQREKIMGSDEGGLYEFDYGRWNFWTF